MIGHFATTTELTEWARTRAAQAREAFERDGSLVNLGYALAMTDIAGSIFEMVDTAPTQLREDVPTASMPHLAAA